MERMARKHLEHSVRIEKSIDRRRATYERKREAIVFPTLTSKRGGACVVIIFLFALVHAAFRLNCFASCPYFVRVLIKRRVLLLYKMLRLVYFRRPLAIISHIRTGFTSSTLHLHTFRPATSFSIL